MKVFWCVLTTRSCSELGHLDLGSTFPARERRAAPQPPRPAGSEPRRRPLGTVQTESPAVPAETRGSGQRRERFSCWVRSGGSSEPSELPVTSPRPRPQPALSYSSCSHGVDPGSEALLGFRGAAPFCWLPRAALAALLLHRSRGLLLLVRQPKVRAPKRVGKGSLILQHIFLLILDLEKWVSKWTFIQSQRIDKLQSSQIWVTWLGSADTYRAASCSRVSTEKLYSKILMFLKYSTVLQCRVTFKLCTCLKWESTTSV